MDMVGCIQGKFNALLVLNRFLKDIAISDMNSVTMVNYETHFRFPTVG